MTFNVRYGTADDGPNHWDLRRELVFATLRQHDYDFIGLQEALPFQIEEIASVLPDHEVLYRTREADPSEGEACAIFYWADRWQLDPRRRGTFWLSETPEVPASRSWDSSLPRIATWGLFSHRESGARVFVFNTHFDHRGQMARERSAELLRDRAASEAGGAPLLVMGDFNAGETNRAITLLRRRSDAGLELVDSFRLVHPDASEVYTGNGWARREEGEKIDGIFVSAGTEVLAAAILRPRLDGRAPSDHDPVTVSLRLRLEQVEIEITDLGECRSCAAGITRGLERVEGVLKATLHPTEPRVLVTIGSGESPDPERLRDVVRSAGYTAGAIRRRMERRRGGA
ncbi:MAG TPA: endonuclease/exonuclease/phosphatase family protein [Thermoanaerobaculia bacterium]|nr:endonuclease/exonuclease/phosphatase family protein [Thermoanaerobaculia bacterium]